MKIIGATSHPRVALTVLLLNEVKHDRKKFTAVCYALKLLNGINNFATSRVLWLFSFGN